MRDKIIEVMAEAIWQAQSIRATDKPRREDWAVQSKKTKDEWRFLARASVAAYESHLQAEGMAVVPGWQPIESAPKDGTRVILSWGGKAILGYYLDNSHTKWPWKGWKVPSMETWPPGGPDAWQPMPLPCAADDGKAEPKDEMGAEGEARSEHTQEKDA